MPQTLKEKKLLNEAVTGETKRCLALVKRAIGNYKPLASVYHELVEEIIKGSPYIEFHPELLRRIPNEETKN
jgi:hypothetical protein